MWLTSPILGLCLSALRAAILLLPVGLLLLPSFYDERLSRKCDVRVLKVNSWLCESTYTSLSCPSCPFSSFGGNSQVIKRGNRHQTLTPYFPIFAETAEARPLTLCMIVTRHVLSCEFLWPMRTCFRVFNRAKRA